MKLLLFSFFINIASAGAAMKSDVQDCGTYKIIGDLRKDPKTSIVMLVHEKTKSQISFSFAPGEMAKVANFLGDHVLLEGTILKYEGRRGVIANITNVTAQLADPLHADLNGGFELKQKMECKND